MRKKLIKIQSDIDNDLYIEDTKILVSDWLKKWLYDYKKLNIKQKTFENYEILMNTHLIPVFLKIKLKDLKTNHVQQFINNKIKSGLSDRTVKYLNTLLGCASEQAVKNDMIHKNVSKAVELPKKTAKKERRILDRNEQTLEKLKVCQFWEHNDLIFCTEFGKPIEPRNLIRILERLTKSINISNINVHALRHTFATRALEKGIPLKVVQDILGHSSIASDKRQSRGSVEVITSKIKNINAITTRKNVKWL